ncbi:hypothetical protein DSC45_23770 [Streptomyces sp. YIM 130001]|uniref:hypothetical protein n=1 Tax=Streptomyces sp. YIM 130001 TaxID=2259644 RepID=UPI000E65388E|nr:hypothetical protein [Streptomyces sp. YIM 130001]RII13372.1 hypothetical protein DSC45_23770 [Streptomyces sp. YIM 130001]
MTATDTAVEPPDQITPDTAPTAQRGTGKLPLPAPVLVVSAVVVVGLGAWVEFWYLPFVAGLVAGAFSAWRRPGLLRAAMLPVVLGPVPWGVLLVIRALAGDTIGGTARTTAGLAGLPASAAVTIALTLLVALLQAATGHWLGRALLRATTTRHDQR